MLMSGQVQPEKQLKTTYAKLSCQVDSKQSSSCQRDLLYNLMKSLLPNLELCRMEFFLQKQQQGVIVFFKIITKPFVQKIIFICLIFLLYLIEFGWSIHFFACRVYFKKMRRCVFFSLLFLTPDGGCNAVGPYLNQNGTNQTLT